MDELWLRYDRETFDARNAYIVHQRAETMNLNYNLGVQEFATSDNRMI